jgi:hypothetical protein
VKERLFSKEFITSIYMDITKDKNAGELGGAAPLVKNSPPFRAGIKGWVVVRERASFLLTTLEVVTLDSRSRIKYGTSFARMTGYFLE